MTNPSKEQTHNEPLSELIELSKSPLLENIYNANHWQTRYANILKLGRAIQTKSTLRLPRYEIKGCEAKLWVKEIQQDKLFFYIIDSESRIIKGLASLLLLQINGSTQAQVQAFKADIFLKTFELDKHISPSRNNGLTLLLDSLQKNH